MLAKCTNTLCCAEFRYLHEGTLFRLELDTTVRPLEDKATEYFWLCGGCSAKMTLRLGEEGTVIAVPLRTPWAVTLRRKRSSWLTAKMD
jgi:hypothetical protein